MKFAVFYPLGYFRVVEADSHADARAKAEFMLTPAQNICSSVMPHIPFEQTKRFYCAEDRTWVGADDPGHIGHLLQIDEPK
jgi:hypothetical protein